MRSYDPADWASFFTALISAAAALTGLLFVAVSVNLDRILKGGRFLPARAAETLAVPMLAITVYIHLRHRAASRADPLFWTVSRMASTAIAIVPATVAGISLTAHWGGGFYWLAAAALLGIIGAVYGAWVLLVTAARQLIRERGYHATALSDVLELSAAPRGSVYFHFPGGKTQLAVSAARHCRRAGRLDRARRRRVGLGGRTDQRVRHSDP